ncbi:tyrosine-type recombinase/integrase [Edwardsiella anguillarum]|uniref:tyrosine-type recombinase/integrase n=1 Tax=Edwardsiella anguillarum TaxID=1821960 RepID=UPI0024B73372|nr:tyrosine-type recombinase/integrase [Edwardsiella anguillarum]WHP79883.1 tyrosine-type recombinase/integrase [Edwardsiella anguillarum]WHQ17343.1 tyrosine-type recombinase/integrase [Edwardsiella anguillarum]WHQ20880.1 tyrosine-type recombinase/integrase [Edwardsiella anguillarum]WHQ24403.1 tyrosine-type recombinase/integrase [Edwardsiella anguillarum]WHQ27971.1 tyrosine-type recombinase/integrase [Edwardsiella anguillarum]
MNRRYITQGEWRKLISSIPDTPEYARDRCLLYMMYMHGLRVSELLNITISNLDLESGEVYIRRLKNGLSTTHPIQDEEGKSLVAWLQRRHEILNGVSYPWLFISKRKTRLSRQQVYVLVRRYGEKANLPIRLHPHVLRHACGYALADQGIDTRLIQDYLGHRNIRHTVHYTASNCKRFSRVWKQD